AVACILENSSFRSRQSKGVREQAAASTAELHNFPRNLGPGFTHYSNEEAKENQNRGTTGIYEQSRHWNHGNNVSASPSLAWAPRSLGDRCMASTYGSPNQ